MSYSLKFKDMEHITESYWDELLVNHERISETYSEADQAAFIAFLNPTDKEALQSILQIPEFEDEQKWNQHLKETPNFLNFLYLKDFLRRKKKAVEEVFRFKVPDYSNPSVSPLIKLIYMFFTSPSWLFEVLVLHEWRNKASGDLYVTDKNFPDVRNKLSSDNSYQTKLLEIMRKNSGQNNDYRVVAHCDTGEKHSIYLMYKKVKDSKRPGYDQNKRIKDRDEILFAIDTNTKTLEIKAAITDVKGVKRYFDEQFNTVLRKMDTELFSDYNTNDIVQLFREGTPVGDEEPEDFSIESITFSNSLLIKSPDVILQLKRSDIWPSVNDAFKRGIVDLYSLKDIKKIGFRSEKHSKSIRSIVLENGNVIFKLNDGGLSGSTKSAIKEKFLKKFGFPLDQPVQNKFDGGEAFKVDQVFRFASTDQFTDEHTDIYAGLQSSQLIDVIEETSFNCSQCSFTTIDRKLVSVNDEEKGKLICPECEESVNQSTLEELIPNKEKIEKYIHRLIDEFVNNHENCDNPKISKQKFKKSEFTFKRFLYNKRPYQVLVTDSLLTRKTLEWIEKKLIPTIIVCYGIDKQTSDRHALETIEQVTFGEVYIHHEKDQLHKLMDNYLEDLEKRIHHQVVTAAMKSKKSLTYIGDKTVDLKDIYDENMLEDDVFTIIKHLFPNSEKWGKEYSGHAVPEGIFAVQYKEDTGAMSIEIKHGFTYDCKFTLENAGYKLGASENRKGLHYIKRLNELVDISYYCTSREITSHIFIGNKFRDRQARAMSKFIREEISKGHHTKPVFINSKDLAYLYDQFIYHKDKIDKIPDIFYKQLTAIFSTDDIIITKEYIDEKLEDIDIAARSYSFLDTATITRKLTGRKK
ncbi:hypothetical protein MNQ98_04855 [Paenibacillus sp. N3/727]|uniref:hypothetical protein n=1 Tax=Paenibacillus sp. N3/727 TaxID=2925845 RepID=UPI001F53365E|nr:hypothetical protein [Paenibacillus sp. N3/727]UNK19366.1 hypothetical protein MNQ98_04855 [Paenibacillus sp. N3/727]